MYPLLQRILIIFYAALPPVAFLIALIWGRRKRTAAPIASLLITCLSGVLLGTSVDVIYVALTRGSITAEEIFRTWYFITSLLIAVGIFRWVVRRGVTSLLRLGPSEKNTFSFRLRTATASALQLIILFGLGLPYVVGTMIVHRVHVTRSVTPMTAIDCDGERIAFTADDLQISGWWIPAVQNQISHKTVVMCGGLGDDLSDAAGFIRVLVDDHYNVLFFFPRGHDGSEGRWTSFGDVERRDVLAAVKWLRDNHPGESRDIKGLGIGMGGAAMLGAATDPSDEGQSIQAVAVCGTYAKFRSLADHLFVSHLPHVLRRWAMDVTLPIASAHAGADLQNFSPASFAPNLWPRPLLVVEGRGDFIFPPTESEALFREATFPKRAAWLPGGHREMMHSANAARELLNFFDTVHAEPAI